MLGRLVRLVSVFIAAVACTSDELAGPPPLDPPLLSAAEYCRKQDSLLKAAGSFLTIDDDFEILARLLPGGFGGLWIDGMYLAYPQRAPDTRTAAGLLSACSHRHLEYLTQIKVVPVYQGHFDYVQLRAWYRLLLTEPGWFEADIDEAKNRLAFGFTAEVNRQRFRRRVDELRIPAGAVHTYIGSPPIPG